MRITISIFSTIFPAAKIIMRNNISRLFSANAFVIIWN
jgi:hypothetical protein